jgi:hypothetical protein
MSTVTKKPKKVMWRQISKPAGVYEVSNTGLVRRIDTKQELKPFGDGRVALCKNGKRHRQPVVRELVKEVFPRSKL